MFHYSHIPQHSPSSQDCRVTKLLYNFGLNSVDTDGRNSYQATSKANKSVSWGLIAPVHRKNRCGVGLQLIEAKGSTFYSPPSQQTWPPKWQLQLENLAEVYLLIQCGSCGPSTPTLSQCGLSSEEEEKVYAQEKGEQEMVDVYSSSPVRHIWLTANKSVPFLWSTQITS